LRLTPLRKDDLIGEQTDLYAASSESPLDAVSRLHWNEKGEVRGPLTVLLRHPASGRPLQELATVLRFSGLLSDGAREAVVLVVAAHWGDATSGGRTSPSPAARG